MKKQIRSVAFNPPPELLDNEITIESPHDCIIFEIVNFRKIMIRPILLYPPTDKLAAFKTILKEEIETLSAVNPRCIDTFYSALQNTCEELKLVRKFKSTFKVKS